MTPYTWKCPRCSAPWGNCGDESMRKKSHRKKITKDNICHGLVCAAKYICGHESDTETNETHPCPRAHCDHCGWTGSMPPSERKT